ncbi:YlcI/YnfO family protein [Candidatus Symbiopectobacterium sp. NZEC135]|uniref:YlcI/YnfO family protein n=1 Tax=Candidatus Symbiopectobacterium sp. NZEC135 TaxID=2820471 RepID=UPI00222662EF|nr:YlcI/YnfO family protein [Candidatus Symbiopectobacterium sp. NZEC135]
MATGNHNNKSTKKGIRFPHELIDEINASVAREKINNPDANFSAWILETCKARLEKEKSDRSKT